MNVTSAAPATRVCPSIQKPAPTSTPFPWRAMGLVASRFGALLLCIVAAPFGLFAVLAVCAICLCYVVITS